MPISKEDRIRNLAERLGIVRARDLDAYGIPREYLKRLCERGILEKAGRGLYVLADAEPSERKTFAEAAKRVPGGVICLLSALQFHELTTQNPFEVWLAIDKDAWRPRVDYPPLRIVYFSGPAFTEGLEEHDVDGVTIKIYSPAKTVADCFKYRNKIGLDVAMEALRECWRQGKCTMDDLWRMAKVCRMSNVMRPYLESLT